ncbi:hypothetical protein [Aurantimonas sp. A3-2-R12]|uniref:hypothetical protein n=2 Tax=unclassified Aurantimonas TaxID=2638230 RepID=UPI002E19BAF0|nr:hypothetical protein [Aurantimonas sp. A3-2-R12]
MSRQALCPKENTLQVAHMFTKTGMTILALTFGSLTLPAYAQDVVGSDQFEAPVEMASLQIAPRQPGETASIPVPMPRPDITQAAQPQQEIRRTASGIRIVGPRFFPAE